MVTMDLAAAILRRGKQLAPDRFPAPDPEVTKAWAKALDKNLPAELWEEAVNVWATTLVTDRMCTPRDMLAAADAAIRRWESDPVRGPQLRAHRDAQERERDRLIANGTFGIERGYTAPAIPAPKPSMPDDIAARLEAIGRRKNITNTPSRREIVR